MRFKWTDQATNQWADGRTTLIWRISIGDASTHLKMRLTKGMKINDILKDKKWADDDDENEMRMVTIIMTQILSMRMMGMKVMRMMIAGEAFE